MCSMHLWSPASSSSILWYPTLVGSYKVSHKVLRDPNGTHASLRWTNHSHSISSISVLPKLMEIIMDKVGLKNVTVWTILAHVTLLTTSVANLTLVLTWMCICLFLIASEPCPWIMSFLYLAVMKWDCSGQHRSDRCRSVQPLAEACGHV